MLIKLGGRGRPEFGSKVKSKYVAAVFNSLDDVHKKVSFKNII